jgi:hypothetical protein
MNCLTHLFSCLKTQENQVADAPAPNPQEQKVQIVVQERLASIAESPSSSPRVPHRKPTIDAQPPKLDQDFLSIDLGIGLHDAMSNAKAVAANLPQSVQSEEMSAHRPRGRSIMSNSYEVVTPGSLMEKRLNERDIHIIIPQDQAASATPSPHANLILNNLAAAAMKIYQDKP